DSTAFLPVDNKLTAGSGTFNATLRTAGLQTVTATDTLTTSVTGISNVVTVSIGAVSRFSISAPTTTVAGSGFTIIVTALDAGTDIVNNYTGTVRFTSTDSQAVLPANSTLTNGVGTLGVTLKTAGARTLTAVDTLTASISG